MPAPDQPIFLVGFMGSGKTAVAGELARVLGWGHVDTDRRVEEREGRSIQAIFEESGEARFRSAEFEVLERLDGRASYVASTGGGLFVRSAARAWMKSRGHTVWLDVRFDVAVRRVGDGVGRPLWAPQDPVTFRALYERRRAVYALAGHRVDASEGTPAAIASRILGVLRV